MIKNAKESVMQMYVETINRVIADHPEINADEIMALRASHHDLDAILDGDYIDNHFDEISTGTYKACYRLSDHFVIKFAQNIWEIEREKFIYDKAHDAGVDKFFVQSYYIPAAGNKIDASIMYETGEWDDDSQEWNEEMQEYVTRTDYVPDFFDYIIIQSRIGSVSEEQDFYDTYDAPNTWGSYSQDTAAAAFTVDDVIDLNMTDGSWILVACERYGVEDVHALQHFICEWGIRDLHAGNTGFMASGAPVIIDWFSNQDDEAPYDGAAE